MDSDGSDERKWAPGFPQRKGLVLHFPQSENKLPKLSNIWKGSKYRRINSEDILDVSVLNSSVGTSTKLSSELYLAAPGLSRPKLLSTDKPRYNRKASYFRYNDQSKDTISTGGLDMFGVKRTLGSGRGGDLFLGVGHRGSRLSGGKPRKKLASKFFPSVSYDVLSKPLNFKIRSPSNVDDADISSDFSQEDDGILELLDEEHKNLHQLCRSATKYKSIVRMIDSDGKAPKIDSSSTIMKVIEAHDYDLTDLMYDQYGSFVAQKIFLYFAKISDPVVDRIMPPILADFANLSKSIYGTRGIQFMIKHSVNRPRVFEKIINLDRESIVIFSNSKYGNHVATLILEMLFTSRLRYAVKNFEHFKRELNASVMDISKDKHGCSVAKTAIKYFRPDDNPGLFSIILENIQILANHEYGTYVIQELIALKYYNREIDKVLRKNFVKFSKLKFSSRVIEKFLNYDRSEIKFKFIDYIFNDIEGDVLMSLLGNEFGNYVIQTAMRNSKRSQLLSFWKSVLDPNWSEITALRCYSNINKILIDEGIRRPKKMGKRHSRKKRSGGNYRFYYGGGKQR